jgi:Ni/Fe-hydrogenase subunit HybB-like protein
VFTSNVFAILGLRSLYFALASVIEKFRYVKTSLVFVLAFVGVKMLIHKHVDIPTFVSLAVVIGTLLVGVLASVIVAGRQRLPSSPLPRERDDHTTHGSSPEDDGRDGDANRRPPGPSASRAANVGPAPGLERD